MTPSMTLAIAALLEGQARYVEDFGRYAHDPVSVLDVARAVTKGINTPSPDADGVTTPKESE